MRDGNWPSGLQNKASARMSAFIGPRLENEIKPAISRIAEREHKWGLYLGLALIGALIAVFTGYQMWKPVGHLALAFSAIACIKIGSVYVEKQGALNTARAALDDILNPDLFQLGLVDVDPQSEDNPLGIYDAAGFFNLYDQVHHLQSYGPIDQDAAYHPLMTHTKLTRTEVEHYTDSQGRRQQRRRIVQVFTGLILSLDVPGGIDDSRILISSRRTQRPRGVFERTTFVGGRKRESKLKTIKTSSLEFGRIFTVQVDDQMEGHEFLDPDRIMRFLNLNKDLGEIFGTDGLAMSMLITRGKAYIALQTGKLQEMHGFIGSAKEMEGQIERSAAQLAIPHIIAEHLKLTPPARYEWDKDIIMKTPKESLA